MAREWGLRNREKERAREYEISEMGERARKRAGERARDREREGERDLVFVSGAGRRGLGMVEEVKEYGALTLGALGIILREHDIHEASGASPQHIDVASGLLPSSSSDDTHKLGDHAAADDLSNDDDLRGDLSAALTVVVPPLRTIRFSRKSILALLSILFLEREDFCILFFRRQLSGSLLTLGCESMGSEQD